ncbi:MAG TPA: hypothetical protein VFO19_12305 [Vicinamibacterales bacterium]|jgi:hypothetical protein|nr:hypothetical protein [Vicinamibacterales bacterium]
MPIWLQDAIVFLVVLAAASVVVRRVFGALKPRAQKPACDSCALADAADRTTARKA